MIKLCPINHSIIKRLSITNQFVDICKCLSKWQLSYPPDGGHDWSEKLCHLTPSFFKVLWDDQYNTMESLLRLNCGMRVSLKTNRQCEGVE